MDSNKKQLIILFSFIGIISIGSIIGTALSATRYEHVFNKNGNVKLVDSKGAIIVIDDYFNNTELSKKTVHEIADRAVPIILPIDIIPINENNIINCFLLLSIYYYNKNNNKFNY